MYWAMLEMGLAIIIACLPVLQSLVREPWPISLSQFIRKLLSNRPAGSSGSQVFQFQGPEDGYRSPQAGIARTQAPEIDVPEESIGMEELDI